MEKNEEHSSKFNELRGKAEKRVKDTDLNFNELTQENVQKIIYELHVHQIELEMQNDELLRTQFALEESRARYFDLYDLAPVGYITISRHGLILEVNLTFATMLGFVRQSLIKQSFTKYILPEDQDTYYIFQKDSLTKEAAQVCELRLLKQDNTYFWARIAVLNVSDENDVQTVRMIVSDISDSKRISEALQKAFDEVRTLRGIVPICANCKKIRNDGGFWEQVDVYIRDHTEAQLSHGICPECMKKLYSDYIEDDINEN